MYTTSESQEFSVFTELYFLTSNCNDKQLYLLKTVFEA